jgi:thiamine-monophosphate kinase
LSLQHINEQLIGNFKFLKKFFQNKRATGDFSVVGKDLELRDIGERQILSSIILPQTMPINGVFNNDDCAVLSYTDDYDLLLTTDGGPTDPFLEVLDAGTPQDLGHYYVTMNASDIAAMGGTPKAMVLTAFMRPETKLSYFESLFEGIMEGADTYHMPLVGGDLKEGPTQIISIAALGTVAKGRALARKGAAPGDGIYVSGALGDANFSLLAAIEIDKEHHHGQKSRISRPKAAIDVGCALSESKVCTSCIDLSDGLISGLQQMSAINNLAFMVDQAKVPITYANVGSNRKRAWADFSMSVGGDYRLLFTLKRENDEWASGIGATRIGTVDSNQITPDELARNILFEKDRYAVWEHFSEVEKITKWLESFR